MPYYLGLDGGGTKTTCAVGDESQTLATAIAGPSNIVRVGEQQTRESLQQCVRQACAAAGVTTSQIVHTCIGGSGAARPELAEIVRSILAEVLSGPVDVVDDMRTSLEAAFGDEPGIIVIAGTGSSAYGRNSQGKTLRAGGWGFAVGDEGSAHWIGRAAISAVLCAADETDANPECATEQLSLPAALLKCWGMTSLSDLARVGNAIPPPDFAALFPAVAASTDELAKDVLSRAGRELARIASIVSRHLFRQDETVKIQVAMVGGVFRYAPLVRDVFYNELGKLDPRVALNPQVVEPVEGALRMARRATAKNAAAESV